MRGRVEAHPLIDLILNAPVTEIEIGPDGLAAGLRFAANDIPQVRARSYVFACGGLETTRLLLATQRRQPSLFGGPEGALGRYYAGHFEGSIADVIFNNPTTIKAFDYSLVNTGAYLRRVLTIPAADQRAAEIQNIVFWPDNKPYHDPTHRSGINLHLPDGGYAGSPATAYVGRHPPRDRRGGIPAYLPHVLNLFRAAVSDSDGYHRRRARSLLVQAAPAGLAARDYPNTATRCTSAVNNA